MADGDILVVGSDGLWDNLHKAEVLEILSPFLRGAEINLKDPSLVAETLAKEAER